MLKRIIIRRFKSIEEVILDLAPINILVGGNNSGKSTLLQAIHFAVSVVQSYRMIVENNKKMRDAFSLSPEQILYAPAKDVYELSHNAYLKEDKERRMEVVFVDESDKETVISIGKGRNKNIAVNVIGDNLDAIADIKMPYSIFIPGLSGIAKEESLIANGMLIRSLGRGDSNTILRNVLYRLSRDEKKSEWGKFSAALSEVFPDHKISTDFKEDEHDYIPIKVEVGNSKKTIDCAGTGFLQVTQLLAYLFLFKPQIALIDEPDSHLHPSNQKALLHLLEKFIQEQHTQIILATHSRHILDVMRDSANITWMRKGSIQPYKENLDVLLDIGALDSAESLFAGKYKYVILTEDRGMRFLKTLLKSVSKTDVFYVLSFKGSDNIGNAEVLSKFIRTFSPKVKIIIHRDSDYLDDVYSKYLIDEFKKLNTEIYFTSGVDVEAAFCRLEHLVELNREHEDIVKEIHAFALTDLAGEFFESAKKGREKIESLKNKHGLGSLSKVEQQAWLGSLDFTQERWIHGKTMLTKLRSLFKEKTAKTLEVEKPSKYLHDDRLKKLFGLVKNEKA